MTHSEPQQNHAGNLLRWLTVILMIYLLLVAVGMIGSGFKWASGGAEGARELFAFARNPVMGLVIGAFATALVQSSSTVTSVIVGLVAGGLPVETAIPMIMGANLGTTVTNTLVSMGHIGKNERIQARIFCCNGTRLLQPDGCSHFPAAGNFYGLPGKNIGMADNVFFRRHLHEHQKP